MKNLNWCLIIMCLGLIGFWTWVIIQLIPLVIKINGMF